jgi:hypothetical protein
MRKKFTKNEKEFGKFYFAKPSEGSFGSFRKFTSEKLSHMEGTQNPKPREKFDPSKYVKTVAEYLEIRKLETERIQIDGWSFVSKYLEDLARRGRRSIELAPHIIEMLTGMDLSVVDVIKIFEEKGFKVTGGSTYTKTEGVVPNDLILEY